MDRQKGRPFLPGVSVLGGASCGLSYEGLMRDAVAQEERTRKQEAGHSRTRPHAQVQAVRPTAGQADQARVAGR